jgi:hypothetical protein
MPPAHAGPVPTTIGLAHERRCAGTPLAASPGRNFHVEWAAWIFRGGFPMKVVRWFPIALALALPATAVADNKGDDRPAQKDMKSKTADKEASHVQSHVVPAIAGIEAADKAAAALYELSGGEQLDQKDAKETVKLARQNIQFALDRAEALSGMKTLSSDAKSEAKRATMKLREARETLTKLDKQVNKKQARISRNDSEMIREQAKDLHTDLSDAENAVERVAKAYDVPTDLEFGG